MIRFHFNPQPDEGFDFQHFTLEGDNAAGYVLLGFNDVKARVGDDANTDFEDEGEFAELAEEELFQRWFDTVGAALGCAEMELGIPRNAWVAPIMKTHSGRLVPPMPQAPQRGQGISSDEERPLPRIGSTPVSLTDTKAEPPQPAADA